MASGLVSGRLARHLHRSGIATRRLRLVVAQRAHAAAPPSHHGGAAADPSGRTFFAHAFGSAPWICALGFGPFLNEPRLKKIGSA